LIGLRWYAIVAHRAWEEDIEGDANEEGEDHEAHDGNFVLRRSRDLIQSKKEELAQFFGGG